MPNIMSDLSGRTTIVVGASRGLGRGIATAFAEAGASVVAFTVREDAEPALLSERPEMLAALRQAFPAALAAWLAKQDDGSWLDVILWRSRQEAEEAAARIDQVPEAKRWFRHIADSKGLRHVEVAHEELFELRYLGDHY